MKKRSFWDRLMTAVKAKDEEAVKAELQEMRNEQGDEGEGEAAKIDNDLDREVLSRVERLEMAVTKLVEALGKPTDGYDEAGDSAAVATAVEKKEAMGDEADPDMEEEEVTDMILGAESAETNGEAKGKVLSGDSIKKIVARAEILAPGSSFKTGDAANAKKEAYAYIRQTLRKAYATDSGREAIEPFLAGRTIDSLKAPALAAVFMGAAELMRVKNNAAAGRPSAAVKDFGRTLSVAEINARNREFWANRNAR